MPPETRTSNLLELYVEESGKIRADFEDSGDGKAAIRARSALIDSIIEELFRQRSAPGKPAGRFCIAAMGGYGRRTLFPY